MTDQKQAPERLMLEYEENPQYPNDFSASVIGYEYQNQDIKKCGSYWEGAFIRKDLHDVAIKRRDELAAERDELAEQLDPSYIDAMSERISELSSSCAGLFMRIQYEMERAERAEAERDQALARLGEK